MSGERQGIPAPSEQSSGYQGRMWLVELRTAETVTVAVRAEDGREAEALARAAALNPPSEDSETTVTPWGDRKVVRTIKSWADMSYEPPDISPFVEGSRS